MDPPTDYSMKQKTDYFQYQPCGHVDIRTCGKNSHESMREGG